ncbi:hypothetical protein [Brevibacterium sp. JSBI002]|uniref:hypothetical protein n=1 Tax=Brevibacterium sp. JSBI002 TaxID=2886045 RepID=UPI0022312018|nr:hypothetical protein [Brevibacterium sp. JSBI002]UZD63023.1 hypothetical protein LJ362_04010 [Brevibacterium sp. JSBI002]
MVLLRTAGVDAFGGKSVLAQFACARVRFGVWLRAKYGGCTIEHMIEYEDYGTATWRYWQKIRNDAGARGSFQNRPPVPVRARVVFERDGEVWLDGTATRLGFDGAIFVESKDRRCQAIGVWLKPDGVWWPGK